MSIVQRLSSIAPSVVCTLLQLILETAYCSFELPKKKKKMRLSISKPGADTESLPAAVMFSASGRNRNMDAGNVEGSSGHGSNGKAKVCGDDAPANDIFRM